MIKSHLLYQLSYAATKRAAKFDTRGAGMEEARERGIQG